MKFLAVDGGVIFEYIFAGIFGLAILGGLGFGAYILIKSMINKKKTNNK